MNLTHDCSSVEQNKFQVILNMGKERVRHRKENVCVCVCVCVYIYILFPQGINDGVIVTVCKKNI